MKELLKNKLNAAEELKKLTSVISELSLIIDYNKVNSLIDERQQYIDKVNIINDRINEAKSNTNYIETDETRKLNKELNRVFREIYEIDNVIRKNINTELKTVKEKLARSETNAVINIKI
ncbi:MAG: hypothetical protein PHP29_10045 [Tissierellia bacterium]|nr:hypothetical protein [Tissierellia bacterium]